MRLDPGERSILAYFPTGEAAREAAGELNGAGLGFSQVDRVSRYGTTMDPQSNNPINLAVTGTGPTLYSDSAGEELSDAERVLLAADPSVSGYGSPGYGTAGGLAFLLTLVTPGDNVDRAVEIIKRHGGTV
ncbi:MAG: hypothetical protein K6T29_10535 [Peptococcaceae bacterium]|nr:hypothetical protein [Peptococcaceae bacterium]